ncbi:MAG: hypothetical protein MUF28_09505 [Ignavibacterium sp.]|jgi:hypothetical protein|nr:hypothetical protein [Ignavibacterium sp.]
MNNTTKATALESITKFSFFAGPILLFISAMTFSLGIGLLPNGLTSYVEGIIGSFAIIFFVPIYLELANQLSATHKKIGLIAAFTGLCGAVVGVSHELFRVIEWTLRNYGATEEVWTKFYANPGLKYLLVALLGPLFPITSIILGAGFLKAKTLPTWISVLLILAGIGFPLAQVLEWEVGLKYTYPMATLFWMMALVSVGSKYLTNANSN